MLVRKNETCERYAGSSATATVPLMGERSSRRVDGRKALAHRACDVAQEAERASAQVGAARGAEISTSGGAAIGANRAACGSPSALVSFM